LFERQIAVLECSTRGGIRRASSDRQKSVADAGMTSIALYRRQDVKNLVIGTRRLMSDDSGQDLLEYALLVALIALVAIVAVTDSGKAVNSIFTRIATEVQNAAQAAGA
jgi:pilus assembly protein Flp/PilA